MSNTFNPHDFQGYPVSGSRTSAQQANIFPPQNRVLQKEPVFSADSVVSVTLLIIGLLVTVSQIIGFLQVLSTLNSISDSIPLKIISVPKHTAILCYATAAGVALFYIGMTLWTIFRLRANRITFFIPLAAGVIATIATCVILGQVFRQAFEVHLIDNPNFLDNIKMLFGNK